MEAYKLPHYTYEDYKTWKGDWELIEGIPYAFSPSPFWKHQRLSLLIAMELEKALEKCNECFVCQEIDWIISYDTVVKPDIVVVCSKIDDYDHIKTTPSIIFEIVSKSTAIKDEKVKFEIYQKEGVKYYILVYSEFEKIKIFELKNRKYEKIFEGKEGSFTFNIKCPVSINFSNIWKRV